MITSELTAAANHMNACSNCLSLNYMSASLQHDSGSEGESTSRPEAKSDLETFAVNSARMHCSKHVNKIFMRDCPEKQALHTYFSTVGLSRTDVQKTQCRNEVTRRADHGWPLPQLHRFVVRLRAFRSEFQGIWRKMITGRLAGQIFVGAPPAADRSF